MNVAYNMDCMEYMRTLQDKAFDLAVVDPPYGIGEDGGKDRSRYVTQKNGARIYVKDGGYEKTDFDRSPADERYFAELFRVSKNQIIWGANYFVLPRGGAIVWDKCKKGTSFSDCELAATDLFNTVRLFRFMWNGMLQGKSVAEGHIMQGNKKLNEQRIHPTQKPVALYDWIFQNYAAPGCRVLDTHLGSGSSRIAAYEAGVDFIGFEIDPTYYAAEEQRFLDYTSQTRLFHLS